MIELISKDKNEKLQFVGRCKLTIDSLSNLLLIEPFNEEHKMISALFEWQFVPQKNILFVFAEYSFQDFALIFDNSQKCNKVWEILLKKGAIFGNNELIHERFLPELFKQILENKDSKMKTIFANWFKLHEKQEKEKCIHLLKNYNIYDDMMKFMNEKNNQKNSRKRKAAEPNETKKVVASRGNFAELGVWKKWTGPSFGLDWYLLDWTGICWTGLVFAGLDWYLLDWTGICWTGLVFAGLDSTFF